MALMENPSFEQADGDVLAKWSQNEWAGKAILEYASVGLTDSRSVVIEASLAIDAGRVTGEVISTYTNAPVLDPT